MTTTTHKSLLVLGMHRSGTSALAGTLSLLGLHPGESLVPSHRTINPRGFWENSKIVEIHDRVLASLNSSWHDERALPDRWWKSPTIKIFRDELVQIMRTDYLPRDSWVIKDPRMCRLMPLWHEVLEEVRCSPAVIIILRDPGQVSKSLEVRDEMSEERSALLWLQHMLEAEKATRSLPRVIVTFDELLEDWRAAIEKIETDLQLKLPGRLSTDTQKVDQFLEASLRHHSEDTPTSGPLGTLARAAYQYFSRPEDEEQHVRQLSHIELQKTEIAKMIAPWSSEIQSLSRAQKSLICAEEAANKAKEAALNEVHRIKSSVSWRVTAPLRVSWNLLRKPGNQ